MPGEARRLIKKEPSPALADATNSLVAWWLNTPTPCVRSETVRT
jgi:hypothetical protein